MTNGVLASRFPSPEGEYTDVKVMQSAAGFYIGTEFVHNGTGDLPEGFREPGSRESEYFPTREEAQKHLDVGVWMQRENP